MDNESASLPSKTQLKNLIARGKIIPVIEILLSDSKNLGELLDTVILLSSQIKSSERDFQMGHITRDEYSVRLNKVTLNLLEVIDSLPDQEFSEKRQREASRKLTKRRKKAPFERALERIEKVKEAADVKLDLAGLGLTEIPSEINEMPSLFSLNLSGNKIKKIENIEGLENLEYLDLTDNNIAEISHLDTLVNLHTLRLSFNPISEIKGLSDLKKLNVLSLHNCDLKRIEGLDELKALISLSLASNQITRIEKLSALSNLTTLDLGWNKISYISSLVSLKKLNHLFINDNQLGVSSLIENDEFFKFLRNKNEEFQLRISNNPFLEEIKSLNISDYPENANHYTTFLKDELIITHKEEEVEIMLPHKLVLLGNSNAGKSSLVDFLRNGKLQDGSPKKSTEVLDIVEWKPRNKPEFLIYDFGGQDYYHATYQMFFSEEASYILLWSKDSNHNFLNRAKTDLRPEDYYCFDVNYWLGNIQYLNETVNANKPEGAKDNGWYKNLILVENKIDVEFDEPKALKADERFGEIEQFKISLWKTEDRPIFKTRRKWLRDFIQSLHQVKSKDTQERKDAIDDFLQEWKNLKESKQKNEWRLEELKDHLKENFESWQKLDNDDLSRILNRFSVSGLIIWYRYVEELKDRIWVDPNQLQTPILELLNHEDLKDFHGKIPLEDFNRLPEFEHYRDLLLQKQIITYDEHDQIYIVPQKLQLNPEEDPLYRIAIQGLESSFTIKFKNFMPLGIMNRLIHMFGKISDKKYYSRYEMVFSLDPEKFSDNISDEKVLLQCDMELLTIRVSSTNDSEDLWKEIFRRILLAYHRIQEHSDDISIPPAPQQKGIQKIWKSITKSTTTSTKLDFEELVPNDLQISLDDEYFVDYAEIKKEVKLKSKKIRASKSKDDSKDVRIYEYSPFLSEEIRRPKKVFISYSHDDLDYRKELQKYLINMERENLIEVWQDGMIQPGTEWDLTIKENLEKADVIILLVSQSFIASNYIHEKELKEAMKKQLEGSAQFFPVLIKNCDFRTWKALPEEVVDNLATEGIPLAKFQFIPQSKEDQRLKPINSWSHPEDAWVAVNNKLRAYVIG